MSRREEKRFKINAATLTHTIVISFLVINGLNVIFAKDGVLDYFRIKRLIARYQEEIRTIERRNNQLKAEIQRLESDDRHIERVAREELGLVRHDELIYMFKDKR